MKRYVLLLLLLSVVYLHGMAQDEAAIERIHDRLVSYFQHNSVKHVCLVTDKEVYKPGEAIRLAALEGSLRQEGPYPAVGEVVIRLYDSGGEQLVEETLVCSDGRPSGSFRVPDNLAGGEYVLEAHLPGIRQEDEAFLKRIFVDPLDKDEMVVRLTEVPEPLLSGKSNRIVLGLKDLEGGVVGRYKLNWTLQAGDEKLSFGKLKTGKEGTACIEAAVPDRMYDGPLLLCVSDSRKLNFRKRLAVDAMRLKICLYPEGGHFVCGLPQKVGFRVSTAGGQAVEIEAEIRGQDGRMLGRTKTLVPGYGLFPVMAEAGERLQFTVTKGPGKGQNFVLPPFEQEGFVLSVPRTDAKEILVNLLFSSSEPRPVNLLVTRGDRLFWASTVTISGSGRVRIPKAGIPGGLVLLKAFDAEGGLLGERLLYTERDNPLQLDVTSESGTWESGEKHSLLIRTPSEEPSDSVLLMVSVTEAGRQTGEDAGLATCFGLNGLLENRIPDVLEQKGLLDEHVLNHLLICNRFRNYSWQSVIDFESVGKAFRAGEDWLSGKVFDRKEEGVSNARVSLVHKGSARIMNVTTDEEGRFVFPGIRPASADEYVLKALSPAGDEKLHIRFDENLDKRLSDSVRDFLSTRPAVEKPVVSPQFYADNDFLFARVKRRSSQVSEGNNYLKLLRSGSSIMDVIKMIKPYQLVDGDKIVFPGGNNSLMAQDGALIVIDGQRMGTSVTVINTLSPYDVASINISTSPIDIQRYTGLNSVGLVEIWTRRGTEPDEAQAGLLQTGTGQEFLGGEDKTTLYWSPGLHLNDQGEVRVALPATRIRGDFLLEVTAVDKTGRIGTLVKQVK